MIGSTGMPMASDMWRRAITSGWRSSGTSPSSRLISPICTTLLSANGTVYPRIVDKQYATGFWIGDLSNAGNYGGGVREGSFPYGIFIPLIRNDHQHKLTLWVLKSQNYQQLAL